ncbi:probable L-cysteine desulfhydrase, chloroplastic [Aplysia californica]|uniref:Probable L-cysteine desulfhydrase, chloroplastic n=1 Tax=Aplysia californica TaxID=6500 RepID=A0ABM0JJN6_APLCA|nr:probable L-cysteine desulfhydrase, chloroplastic [Aplysia californica]
MHYRLNAKLYMDLARKEVADFVGADVDNLFLVPNATTALNCVVKSYPFAKGDAILDTTWTYGSVYLLCEDLTTRIRPDVERVKLELTFPCSGPEEIIKKYEETFQKHPNIKMAVIDHITSPSSVVLPIKELVELCHRHGALAVIDGAHSVGQIPLNLTELGADFFTSNLHKWCYCPRGSALLYCAPQHTSWLHPTNTSWHLGGSLDMEFFDLGTRDHVPFYCARNAIQFYKALGGMEKIVGYTTGLAEQAKQLFEKDLGLTHLDIPASMEAPNMKMLKLPPFRDFPYCPENTWKLMEALFGNTKIFGILTPVEGAFYFRYSVQIYNDMDDIRAAADVIKAFMRKHAA